MADDLATSYYRHRHRPSELYGRERGGRRECGGRRAPAPRKPPLPHYTANRQALVTLYYNFYQNRDGSPCNYSDHNIPINNNKIKAKRKQKKRRIHENTQCSRSSATDSIDISTDEYLKIMSKCSMPEMTSSVETPRRQKKKWRRSETCINNSTPYQTKYVVNAVLLDPKRTPPQCHPLLQHPLMQAHLRIYRCQLSSKQESCCCSCNSDAMFEVMKSLYDCYKKKDCKNCNCVLCGHLPVDERRRGEARKSSVGVGVETASTRKKTKATMKTTPSMGPLEPLAGLTSAEKEEALKDLAKKGVPLPEGQTYSEKRLIAKVTKDLGISTPEHLKKAKAAGLLTPIEGKSDEQKAKIIRGLALASLPLPEGKTASERKIIDRVRKDLGLPPEPKSSLEKVKYVKAQAAGFITPLEGKSKSQKEKILKGLAERGIPLPEGRTLSEKSLIQKIKAEVKPTTPSAKIRKAKESGFMTPLEGKTSEQKEKIIRGRVMSGMPLPEAKTASEKKIIEKTRKDLGLPPEPKTASEKQLLKDAQTAGIITPLEGKSKAQKEKILKGLAERGIPLPEGRTSSEKSLIQKIQAEVKPLPSKPTTPSAKIRKAKESGFMTPLEGKTSEQKEKIIRGRVMSGMPLPEAKTASEKKIIEKTRKDLGLPPEPKTASEKQLLKDAQTAGIITPLEGKSKAQKEKILSTMAEMGVPLPEGRTASEKELIRKVQTEVIPIEALPSKERIKLDKKTARVMKEGKGPSDECICGLLTPISERLRSISPPKPGLMTPLEGKTASEKERILRGRAAAGLPMPEGKTVSERALIKKVKTEASHGPPAGRTLSAKERQAKAAGFLTPLEGKTSDQKEAILRGRAKAGLPLPEGKTASEKRMIKKIRSELGLPPEPTTRSLREKMEKAQAAGIITPLEGKTSAEKEQILKNMAAAGIPLPEGRTSPEKALIRKITAEAPSRQAGLPSAKMQEARAAGFLTPLEGKTTAQKQKILEGLAKSGVPLPEAKTASEKKLIEKVRTDLGLPPEPTTKSLKAKMSKAYGEGIITPLEGKTSAEKEKILKRMATAGIPLPEGRTSSEKSLIQKIQAEVKPLPSKPTTPSAKIRKAKESGFMTPLEGKTSEQKEKIIRGRVMSGMPLPEAKTASEKKIIEKTRKDLGLPPEPKTASEKQLLKDAQTAGIITPLEGKSKAQKEKILSTMAEMGVPLPEGRTASEKELIRKVQTEVKPIQALPSKERIKLDKKTAKVMKEGKGPSDECICGLLTPVSERLRSISPPKPGLMTPLEGKTASEKERILRGRAAAGLPMPEGKTVSERALIKKVKTEASHGPPVGRTLSAKERQAKAAGFLTPLEGKTSDQKEAILRGRAKAGLPLPEGKTASEKRMIKKIRSELGLPPEPTTRSLREKMEKAQAAGIITPLEGKTSAEKEQILKNMAAAGIPLPEGRTSPEKALIRKITAEAPSRQAGLPSAKMREARAAGFLTPLEGKTTAQKQKILEGLAKSGVPLPEAKTASEKKLIEKVRTDLGLPPEPTTKSLKAKMSKAYGEGIITPLEGKTSAEKEKILKRMATAGIPLPEGRTASEKALTKKIETEAPSRRAGIQSAKIREARAAGLMTPLTGKSPQQQENILKGLAQRGIPLPEGKTASERKIIAKVRANLGLPPEPTTKSMREKISKAVAAGIISPLEGKTTAQKEKILKNMAAAGIPLPEGRTASERSLIKKIAAEVPSAQVKTPSEKMREAKAAGLITPLEGKSQEQKEKILKALAKSGVPLPEPKTASEKRIIDKVRTDLGLPPEPTTRSMKEKMSKAIAAGVVTPLEGKTPAQKENILKSMAAAGIPLPEGRTASEKSMIKKIKTESKAAKELSRMQIGPPALPPEKRKKLDERTAKNIKEGTGPVDECICPLLTPESDRKESEAAKIERSARQVGVSSAKIREAKAAGLMTPLEGKTASQKEQILRGLAKAGIPLPEAKTASEKKIAEKVRTELGLPPEPTTKSVRDRISKAQAAGIVTPLEGKTSAQKEKILRGMAAAGVPLPEGRTASEKALIKKVATEVPAKIPSEKMRAAKAAGLLTPLDGKTQEQKERIIKGLVKSGIPLPQPRTSSEREVIAKVRTELGLPPEPTSKSIREKMSKAQVAGIITPLEGKTSAQKEKILKSMAKAGIPLPEGRTPSEKALIKKIQSEVPLARVKTLSQKMREAKAAGLITPLEGKSPEQKEKILKVLAKSGVPLPEPKTASEKRIIDKVRTDLGLPPEPTTRSMKEKMSKAIAAGVVTALEGKTPAQKEKILKSMAAAGIPLPEGRTASEKSMIKKIKTESKAVKERSRVPIGPPALPPEKRKKLDEKTAKKVKEGTGPVDECICSLLTPESDRVSIPTSRKEIPGEGITVPLEGKTHAEKEMILKKMASAGVPLPEGRTSSEKALIRKIEAEAPSRQAGIPSAKLREAKAAGLMTPLDGKTAAQQEKILKGLVEKGLPLPEGKTSSQKRLIQKVRAELGLPPAPTTRSIRERMSKAQGAGIITPLEGKTASEKAKILKRMASAGVPLPEGRTSSEKALIRKIEAEAPSRQAGIPSAKLREAKAAGLMTPLDGKTAAQQEKILKGLVEQGLPLPEGKTPSQKRLIQKVRAELGLPPAPTTRSIRERMSKAQGAGIITPLEGKTASEKAKILKRMASAGVPLPEGRTSSEKALIRKIEAEAPSRQAGIPSAKLREAKAAGLMTPLDGKTAAQQEKILKGLVEKGLPLPEGKTPSQKRLIQKVRAELGLPPAPTTKSIRERISKAHGAGVITPLEGKSAAEKEKILKKMASAGVPLPEGRTSSEKALIRKIEAEAPSRQAGIPSAKLREAKAAGLMTPLDGKTAAQQEKILKGLVEKGLPLPEGKTPSQKRLIQKVRAELGLPPAPTTKSIRERISKAHGAGIITPLEGKSAAEKEKILKKMASAGVPLPEGRTSSEKALIRKIEAEAPSRQAGIPSAKLREAKAAGLMTPLDGKTVAQQEKILKGLVEKGLPLPEGKTPSQKRLIQKVRAELGLPPAPTTKSIRERISKAQGAGIITPLEGKTASEKAKILKRMASAGVPLPEGRTSSEKALIRKIEAEAPSRQAGIPSAKLREAKAAGLMTPLDGKTAAQQEKILKGLVEKGLPLPEGKTPSQKRLIQKVRAELGLPPAPTTKSIRERISKAHGAGIITPLEGKSAAEKEKILKKMASAGVPLPEGRTSSEKALIKKIEVEAPARRAGVPSVKLQEARAAGFLTPLAGKTSEQKEKILKGLAKSGVPMPEAKTPSEKRLIEKVRTDLGLPSEPERRSMKEKLSRAQAAGIVTPLEGKTKSQKEKILKGMAAAGVPLPEGRTASEKDLIRAITTEAPSRRAGIPSAKLREARAAGLLTPLAGKSQSQQEKILKGLAKAGIPLPEGKTASERRLIQKVRADLGLPPEPTTKSIRERMSKAHAAGIITPLEGKTPEQKEQILRKLAAAGIPLPEGKTSSEKALIRRVTAEAPPFISPLEGKTDAEKEKILRQMTAAGIPLPEGQTPSEKDMIRKAKKESRAAREFEMERVGPPALPPEARRKLDEKTAKVMKEGKGPSDECICPLLTPETDRVSKPPSRRLSRLAKISEKIQKVQERGLLTPLEGKTKSEKERIIKGMADAGLPLPEATTPSEKSIVKKVTAERLQKAKERGLLTPLAGKSKAEQERIIKGLAEAGLPLPEAKTASEKALIQKVKTDYEITPSIKKKLRTAKSGPAASRKVAKGMVMRSAAGIQEEIEEIVKTTTCERGCGCDKKRIRFKHSYVKIRVTSPDISSFCACPDECIPGVKGGVFTDNEGIKVTIGTATGVPSLSKQTRNSDTIISYKNKSFRQSKNESDSCRESHISLEIASLSSDSLFDCEASDSNVYIYNSETDISVSDIKQLLHRSIYEHNLAQRFEELVPKENPLSHIYQSRYNEPARPVNKLPRQVTSSDSYYEVSDSSSGSFYVVETESSDSDQSAGTADVLSLLARNLEPSTDIFHGRQLKHAETKHKLRENFKDASLRPNLMPVFTFHRKRKRHSTKGTDCRGSESIDWCGEMARSQGPARRCASCVSLTTASSICVVMSTSEHESCSDGCESTLCFEMSGMMPKVNELCIAKKGPPANGKLGLRFSTKGGKVMVEGPLREDIWDSCGNHKRLGTTVDMCQTSEIKFRIQLSGHSVSTDTTADRPCCCAPAPPQDAEDSCSQASYASRASPPSDHHCLQSVISDFMNPLLTHAPGLQNAYMNVGFNQTPSSFHTTVTCQRGDSKVMWDLPPEPGTPNKPCTPETCHTPPTGPQYSPPTGGGFTGPQYSPPTGGGFTGPQYSPPTGYGFTGPQYSPPTGYGFTGPQYSPPTGGGFTGPQYSPPTEGGFTGPQYSPPTGGGFTGPQYSPPTAPTGCGFTGPQQRNHEPCPALDSRYAGYGGRPFAQRSPPMSWCKDSPCSVGCHPYEPPPPPPPPPADAGPGMGPDRYSGVEFSPEILRERSGEKESQSVGVEATCSMISNLLDQKLKPNSSKEPPFLYESKIWKDLMDRCTSTEELIRNKKALLRQAAADSMARELRVDRNVETDGKTCRCEKASGPGRWTLKKNHICECPPAPPPPPPPPPPEPVYIPLDFDWSSVDEIQKAFDKEQRKMKSDLTQTMSGFKVLRRRKAPPEPEVMSYEDMLAYYDAHPEEVPPPEPQPEEPIRPYDNCACHETPGKKNQVECECLAGLPRNGRNECGCPPEPEEPAVAEGSGAAGAPEPPFPGLKFHIGGKGSATPGLTGICCFDFTEGSYSSSQDLKYDSESSSY